MTSPDVHSLHHHHALLHKRYTALLLHFRVDGVQPTQAQSIQVWVPVVHHWVAVYLIAVPSHLVIGLLKSDQLTPRQPWSPRWQLCRLWRFMWVNSFETVSINCVGLKPSANSFKPQPPSSWSICLGHIHCLQGWLLQQHTGGSTEVSARSDTVSAKRQSNTWSDTIRSYNRTAAAWQPSTYIGCVFLCRSPIC